MPGCPRQRFIFRTSRIPNLIVPPPPPAMCGSVPTWKIGSIPFWKERELPVREYPKTKFGQRYQAQTSVSPGITWAIIASPPPTKSGSVPFPSHTKKGGVPTSEIPQRVNSTRAGSEDARLPEAEVHLPNLEDTESHIPPPRQ